MVWKSNMVNSANPYSIIIDTQKLTLTLYKNSLIFRTYRVCAGKPSSPTPKGDYNIVNKAINPGGPFGARWLGLNIPFGDYGIHGTNAPYSIGKHLSNGCIRMYNNDVIELSSFVAIGTHVKIL